jgi:hypothetical protein
MKHNKVKGNPPSLKPSLKFQFSKKATEDEFRNQNSEIRNIIIQMLQ